MASEAPAPQELGDAGARWSLHSGNAHFWVIRKPGTSRALRFIFVLFSSLSRRPPRQGIAIGKSTRSLRDAWLPLGRSRPGAAKRGAGGRPEARRGGVALRFPSLQVPGSPAEALPAAPSLLCPRLRSCRQLLGDGERLVLSSSLPGGRGLGAGVRRGLNQDLFVIPAAGEVRGTSPTQRGAEVGAGEAGQRFPGMSSGPCLPPRAVGSVQLSPNLSLPGTWTA